MTNTSAQHTGTSGAGSAGLRARKKRATRRALQQAAIQLFRERGPESVTIDDICARGGVSPRTFFNYFAGKEEVLIPWDPEVIACTPAQITAQPAERTPLEAAHSALANAIDTAMAGPTWRDQALLLHDHPELIGKVAASSRNLELALVDGLAERTGRDTADSYVRLVAAASAAAMRTSIQGWHEADPGTDVHELLDTVFADLRNGLQDG